MSKFEDKAMELIETMAENSHHKAEKPFERGATLKGGLIDTKSVETGMLLEKIDKMAEVQNLLLDRFHIRNGSEGLAPVALQEASPCAHCSRLDHVEMDCPIMAIQGQGIYRQGPPGGPSQQGRPNYQGTYPNYFNTLFITILCSIKDLGETSIKRILHLIMPVSNKIRNRNPTQIQDSRRISRHINHTIKLHDQPHHLQI